MNNNNYSAAKKVLNIKSISINKDAIDIDWVRDNIEGGLCLALERSNSAQVYKDKKTGEVKGSYKYFVKFASALCSIELELVARDRFDGNPKLNGMFDVVNMVPLFLEEKNGQDGEVFLSYTAKLQGIDGSVLEVDMKGNTSNDKKGLNRLFANLGITASIEEPDENTSIDIKGITKIATSNDIKVVQNTKVKA